MHAALSVAFVMLVGLTMLMRCHHHNADGSVCLCMSLECHASGHHHDCHGGCCQHNHSDEYADFECQQWLEDYYDDHADISLPPMVCAEICEMIVLPDPVSVALPRPVWVKERPPKIYLLEGPDRRGSPMV